MNLYLAMSIAFTLPRILHQGFVFATEVTHKHKDHCYVIVHSFHITADINIKHAGSGGDVFFV